MKPIPKVLALVCIFAALIGGYFWIDREFRAAMASSNEFKRMHVAPGTLKSVSGTANRTPTKTESVRVYNVCFAIDSFSDVPPDLEPEYAAAERSRTAKDGPRCIRVSHQHSIDGTPGEAIRVYYLLEGHGAISVERLTIGDEELNAI